MKGLERKTCLIKVFLVILLDGLIYIVFHLFSSGIIREGFIFAYINNQTTSLIHSLIKLNQLITIQV